MPSPSVDTIRCAELERGSISEYHIRARNELEVPNQSGERIWTPNASEERIGVAERERETNLNEKT